MTQARQWVAVDFGGPEVLRCIDVDVESGPFRARARAGILRLARDGNLVVPIAQTFSFERAPAAVTALTGPHPAGKLALVNQR